jgi:hypothetical protein
MTTSIALSLLLEKDSSEPVMGVEAELPLGETDNRGLLFAGSDILSDLVLVLGIVGFGTDVVTTPSIAPLPF